jgi:hypothetical protein
MGKKLKLRIFVTFDFINYHCTLHQSLIILTDLNIITTMNKADKQVKTDLSL